MTKKLVDVRLVIPDTGILISLAHGDLLDVLLNFAEHVSIVITDVVEFEATRKENMFDARRIQLFLEKNKERITVEPTSFHAYLQQAKINPDIPVIPDMGELSIYGFINDIRNDIPKIPTLILFEDNWFVNNQAYRPTSTHLVSLVAFLKYAEHVIADFNFEEAIKGILNTRPGINRIEIDSSGLNDPDDVETSWKSTYRLE